jgi:hypothetical protein
MIGHKTAICAAIAMLVGFQISKVYVPEGFERPTFFRLKSGLIAIIGSVVLVLFHVYFVFNAQIFVKYLKIKRVK